MEWLLPGLLSFLLWLASLFIPLFLIPQALLRLGLKEVWARAVGWMVYVLILAAVVTSAEALAVPAGVEFLWAAAVAVIAFAIGWDLWKARRREAAGGREP